MRIFLTGATGFIGSHVIPELLGAGHQVVGVTRSETGAETLRKAGVEPFHGVLEEPQALAEGAENVDAVIHCAFDHDFSNFVANCEKDRAVIGAIGAVLKGSDRPFMITSGCAMGATEPGTVAVETVFNADNPSPRAASEAAAAGLIDQGVRVIVMRLPQVHDTLKQGLVSPMILMAKAQGRSAYVGDGANRFAACHVSDAALLYRLAIEQGKAGERFHAVDEEGISAKDIATAVGEGLGVPTVSLNPDEAAAHFGMFAWFATVDMPASGAWTQRRLNWTPKGPDLLTDLRNMDYAALG